MLYRVIVGFVCAPLLAACAGTTTSAPSVSGDEIATEKIRQQIFQIQTQASNSARLYAVSFRLESANRTDCGANVAPRLGFTSSAPADFPAATRDLYVSAFQLESDQPKILSVVDSGPAAKAGLLPGDVLLAFDGERVPNVNSTTWVAAHLKTNSQRAVRIEVLRQNQSKTITASPALACSFPVLLAGDNEVNAFTDGSKIVVHTGVLRVAQSDAELAIVVGHELAHVTMNHLGKQSQNQAAGAVGGAVADVALALLRVNTGGAFTRAGGGTGAKAFAADFEKEADYVGAYYAARAGYNVAGVENFWRAMAQENPKSVYYAGLHPTTPERFIQMQKTSGEIAAKQHKNMALNPEQKSSNTPANQSLPQAGNLNASQ